MEPPPSPLSLQLPRLYNVYKEMGIVASFQTLLDNVFEPLFEVSLDPSSHPHLHIMLNQVSKPQAMMKPLPPACLPACLS